MYCSITDMHLVGLPLALDLVKTRSAEPNVIVNYKHKFRRDAVKLRPAPRGPIFSFLPSVQYDIFPADGGVY